MPATLPNNDRAESIPLEPARLTAWTTYAELNADQRKRFGRYILAKEQSRREGDARQRAAQRTRDALERCGGDKGKALLLLIGEGK